MDLKNKLLKDIYDLSDKSEKPYAGVSEDLDSVKGIGSDIGSATLSVIKEILDGAGEDSLDGLKHRIKRAEELKKNLEKAQLGSEETGILNSCISRVTFAIESHIQQKRKILSAASGAISKITPQLGTAMLGMSYNNPVMQLAVMAGGKLSQIVKDKMQKNKESKDILKGDAKKLYSSSLSQAEEGSGSPSGEPPSPGPADDEFGPGVNPGAYGGLENFNNDGSSLVMESSAGYGKVGAEIASDVHFIAEELLLVIDGLKPLEQISNNIEKLVRASEEAAEAQDRLTLDNLESSAEGSLLPGGDMNKAGPAGEGKSGKGGLLGKVGGMLPDMKGLGKVASTAMGGLSKALFSGTTALVAGLVWATIDGVTGWLKSGDWGVGKIAGFIGGFFGGTGDNQVKRTIGNMGKWALIGAGIGSFIPVVGTAIGGLIGALIGGILGWIGGQNIAIFFDDFGTWITNSFTNGIDTIKNFIYDIWDFVKKMVNDALNVVDTIKMGIVGWVKSMADWLIDLLPDDMVPEALLKFSQGAGEKVKEYQGNIDRRNAENATMDEESKQRWQTLDDQKAQQQAEIAEKEKTRAEYKERVAENASTSLANPQTPGASAAAVAGGSEFISSETGKPVPSTGFDGKPSTNVAGPSEQSLSKDETKSAVLAELQAKGITDPNAQANILANLQAESNFKAQSENLNYSAKTLMKLYGPGSGNKVRVKSMEEAQAIVDRGPEAVGNLIYGGRMGNAANEGYKFRGRGLVQLTGKDNYTAMSKKLGIDLVNNPDLANDPQIAAKISAQYYADRKSKFNYNDITQVAKATGHAGGHQETLKRAGYAQSLKAEIASGKISADGVVSPESIKPDLQGASIVPASYNTVNKQSAQTAQAAPTIVNNVNNTSSVSNGGGQQQSRPNDTGTSSMRPTVLNAYRA